MLLGWDGAGGGHTIKKKFSPLLFGRMPSFQAFRSFRSCPSFYLRQSTTRVGLEVTLHVIELHATQDY